MHHHAGRLVDHGEVLILKDHVEWNVFGDGFEGRGMRLAGDGDLLAAAQLERGLNVRAVDEDVALFEEQLHARAANAFDGGGEEVIEALANSLGRNGDLA